MARKLISPEHILPTRMMIKVPDDTALRFSVLDFPYAKAIEKFLTVFKQAYHQQHSKHLPYALMPPYRQLNNAIIALAPTLIQGFEGKGDTRRMVGFTRYDEHGDAQDYPTLDQITNLIQHWILSWSQQKDIQNLILKDANQAWNDLQQAFNNDPETDWKHHIKPITLINDLNYENGLAYVALPALLTTLLENKTSHIYSGQREYKITWRRVNTGSKNGFYLISQPILYKDDYFAYRLDFNIETQAGYIDQNNQLKPWIFASLSIQRYITNQYKGDFKRDNSILVGFNREHFDNTWNKPTTTLVRLSAEGTQWADKTEQLLNKYMVKPLIEPDELFQQPMHYGNYDSSEIFKQNEYYIVYAEGRKFGERARKHQANTGTSLRERSQIMSSVLFLLQDWLEISPPYEKDMQNPQNTFALRDYDYMIKNTKASLKHASWQNMLQTSLRSSGCDSLHIALLYRSEEFLFWAKKQVEEALMDTGNISVSVSFSKIEPSLYMPLDAGQYDPQMMFLRADQRPPNFTKGWYAQMRLSYPKKRDEWRNFLNSIPWQPNSRRMVLIDSTGEKGEKGKGIPDSQKIKGAIRDACNQEGIASQFIVGNLAVNTEETGEKKLSSNSIGTLKNAVLDLILRQQGILYAPPHEIYTATGLNSEIAQQLDVIAFSRVKSTSLDNFNYVLAVRLRADGTVNVMSPDQMGTWMPYDEAAWEVGKLILRTKHMLHIKKDPSPIRLNNAMMLDFVHDVITKHLERPTIAVIEAEGWRNKGDQDCWTQLSNPELTKDFQSLRFDGHRHYDRSGLNNLLCVIRLRDGKETPQYITSGTWTEESPLRDIPHLTSYVDPYVSQPLHFLSIAQLSDTQKKQKEKKVVELFKGDTRDRYHEIPFKHPQIIELVPFFVRDDYLQDEGQRQLCRCVHLLRNSPGFVMGAINQPYPMHLGEALINDQLCLINADA